MHRLPPAKPPGLTTPAFATHLPGTGAGQVEPERAAARIFESYWDGWHQAFPGLHKRAHWHIIHHLCTQPPPGAPLGEIFGLTRQALLLDDATARERVNELVAAQFCETDPPGAVLSARTLLQPTAHLRAGHDATLLALLGTLAESAHELQPGLSMAAPARLAAGDRALALEALSALNVGWSALLEQLFDMRNLSSARRLEARRQLLSTSHRTLMLMAVAHRFGPPATPGILADRMAATLLDLTGQNFQTTRDHIAALLALGLLERRPGRALSLSLSDAVLVPVRTSLADTAQALAAIVRRAGTPGVAGYALRVAAPGEPPRMVSITAWPFTIGRTENNALRLPAADVSRTHCELALRDGNVVIEDLGSTNGTNVNGSRISSSMTLHEGATIELGPFNLTLLTPADTSDETIRHRAGAVPAL
jgi:hypothetical protein